LKTCILFKNAGDPKKEDTKQEEAQRRGDLEGEQLDSSSRG